MLLSVPQIIHSHVDWSEPVNWQWPGHRNLQSWFLSHPGGCTGWGSTRWRDLVGKNHGTVTNIASPPTSTSGWATARGRPGGAGSMRFDGTNDRIVCSSYPLTGAPMGVSGWVNLPSGPVGTVWCSHDSGVNNGWRVVDITASSLRFILGAVANYDFSSLTPATGWNFFAVSWDGSNVTGWLKTASVGLKSQTLATSSISGTPNTFAIANNGSGSPLIGWADDVRVFKSSLTDAQVRAIYDDSIRGYPDSLSRFPIEQWFADTPAAGGSTPYWSWWAWNQFGRPLSPEA